MVTCPVLPRSSNARIVYAKTLFGFFSHLKQPKLMVNEEDGDFVFYIRNLGNWACKLFGNI
jgi:hypothetical protein